MEQLVRTHLYNLHQTAVNLPLVAKMGLGLLNVHVLPLAIIGNNTILLDLEDT